MKITILLFTFFLSFLSVPIFGQVKNDTLTDNSVKYKYALGVGFGPTTGYGLAFKYTPSKFGIQTTVGALSYSNDNKFSFGLTLFYTLIDAEKTSLFLYQGNHFNYSVHQYHSNSSYNTTTKYFNNGIGFGVEVAFYDSFSFNVMAGYALYENFDRLSLTGEAGLFYKF